MHLETRLSKRAHRGARARAGALPLCPLAADFFRYDNLAHVYQKNPTDGLLCKYGGGINPWKTLEALFDPYINRPLTSAFNTNPFHHSFLPELELAQSRAAPMADKFHDDWEVVPYNLNKKPKEDPDAYALVPANIERQLAAMPSRQRSSTQSFYAQSILTAPPQALLLKGPSAKQEAIVKVPTGTRILHLDPMSGS